MNNLIRFFSDPHLGLSLKANTTPASRAALRETLTRVAKVAAGSAGSYRGLNVVATVCGGDLFHTDSNEEAVLVDGAKVADLCTVVLGGNHDVINVAGRVSTLAALDKLYGENSPFVIPPGPGRVNVGELAVWAGDIQVKVFTVPHHATQQLFEEALEKAVQRRLERAGAGTERNLLLLHCNWDLQVGGGENDLNLTLNRAQALLQHFDYIVLGHDHRPRTEMGGRVVILGNTHPTSFSDLGEKFTWYYDAEGNAFVRELLVADRSVVMPAEQLIEAWQKEELDLISGRGIEWLDLTGELQQEASVDLARAIRALWAKSPSLYAIRASKVRYAGGVELDREEAGRALNIMQLVEEQLNLPGNESLLAVFNEAKGLEN